MKTKTSILVFGLTVTCILFQAVVYHAWNIGTLREFASLYQSFGQAIPAVMAYGLRNAQNWWLAPLLSTLFLAVVCFAGNRSRWLFAPFLLSLAVLVFMLYVMYPVPNLIKMGLLSQHLVNT